MVDLPGGVEDRYILPRLEDLDKTPIIKMKARPNLENPVEWAAMLVCQELRIEDDARFTKIYDEIARIDNSHGQKPHIHRFFEEGEPREDLPGMTFHQAREYLESNHETFVTEFFSERIGETQ